MRPQATPEEQEQHAARLKMADDKWAALVADAHYEDAADIHKWYWTVGFTHGLREAQAEIDKLREAICRLADQDATLSVCDGNVTVTMDAVLTDAEPAAWSLFLDGKRARVICEKEDALRFVGREPKYTLAPLYDYPPQPTLTDAEREAVVFAVAHGETVDASWRYTLRGLLERMK